jgi:metallophosphoesterase superfamily enzyme
LYATLRSEGAYLPIYDAQKLEEKLQGIINEFFHHSWILVGDTKHSHHSWKRLSSEELDQIQEGFNLLSQVKKVTMVIGNHDFGLTEIIEKLGFSFDSVENYMLNQITIVHQTDFTIQNNYQITGHIHPKFKQNGLSVPIFAVGDYYIVLPAFNPVAGGYNIARVADVVDDQWKCYGIFSNTLKDLGPLEAWYTKD